MSATINCAHCGGTLARSDRFCDQCGAEVHSCVTCGESLLPAISPAPPAAPPPSLLPDESFAFQPTDAQAPWLDMVRRLRRATLGEFEIVRELGRGGMAVVFLAHETSLARKVAIKVMSPGLLLDDGMIDRFRHEAITIAHLHHPNIVSLYSVRQAEGLHFFVMQYVHGRSLEQVIELGGRLPVPVVRSILSQVGSALTYAHRSRVIHRDIKPANILIDGDGNAVVTDFGIAKAAKTPSQTLTGALVGTPAYMAPSMPWHRGLRGLGPVSLGAVAYEMLTGAPPFGGSTLTVMQAHVEREPIPLRDLTPTVRPSSSRRFSACWQRIPPIVAPHRRCDRRPGRGALAEDDPLRAELSRLAATAGQVSHSADTTPISSVQWLRPSSPRNTPAGLRRGDFHLAAAVGLEVGRPVFVGRHGPRKSWHRASPNAVTWSCDRGTCSDLSPAAARRSRSASGPRC